jgi:hypothetical protein
MQTIKTLTLNNSLYYKISDASEEQKPAYTTEITIIEYEEILYITQHE